MQANVATKSGEWEMKGMVSSCFPSFPCPYLPVSPSPSPSLSFLVSVNVIYALSRNVSFYSSTSSSCNRYYWTCWMKASSNGCMSFFLLPCFTVHGLDESSFGRTPNCVWLLQGWVVDKEWEIEQILPWSSDSLAVLFFGVGIRNIWGDIFRVIASHFGSHQ